jgi:hypothetical protein
MVTMGSPQQAIVDECSIMNNWPNTIPEKPKTSVQRPISRFMISSVDPLALTEARYD